MGQVIRKTSRTGHFLGWYVRFIDSDGKRKAKATKATSAAEARRILVELEAAAGRRQLGVPDRPQPIKGVELIGRWIEESQPRTTNRQAWALRQRHALVKVWTQLNAIIGREDAQRIVRKLDSDGYKPATIRTAIACLKAAWRWAVEEGITEVNPWAKLRLPRAESRIEYLSRSEIAILLDAVDKDRDVVAVAVRLALFAGLRVSEVWGLRWRSADLDRGVLTVRNGYKNAPTKSRRERVIPMADQLRDALAAWQKRCPSREMVCPSLTGEAKAKRLDIRRLYRKAGLHVPSAPWHVLRHTFASHFLMSGGSLLTLQRLLGHTSVAITQIYSHLSDEHIAGEMKRLKF
mgnify:CR=1 FL=1